MTEYEKMHNGMIYDCPDAEPGQVQKHSHRLCEQYHRAGQHVPQGQTGLRV